jgi:hypothetical protein
LLEGAIAIPVSGVDEVSSCGQVGLEMLAGILD